MATKPKIIVDEYMNVREIPHELIIDEWNKPNHGCFHSIREDTLGFTKKSNSETFALPPIISYFVGEKIGGKKIIEAIFAIDMGTTKKITVLFFQYKEDGISLFPSL